MKEVTNQTSQPLSLDDGTVLAAAGTPGSTKQVSGLAESDQRFSARGMISVRETKLQAVPPAPSTSSDDETQPAKEKK
jgi:hypothetical protein